MENFQMPYIIYRWAEPNGLTYKARQLAGTDSVKDGRKFARALATRENLPIRVYVGGKRIATYKPRRAVTCPAS